MEVPAQEPPAGPDIEARKWAAIVLIVRAAIGANEGTLFRYPFTLRLIK